MIHMDMGYQRVETQAEPLELRVNLLDAIENYAPVDYADFISEEEVSFVAF